MKIGNLKKDFPNVVFSSARMNNTDYDYWYSELYGEFPVYKCEYKIVRENNTDLRKLYVTIFEDLINTGEFEAVECSYGNVLKEGSWDDGEMVDEYTINNFCVASVSPLVPMFISFSYGCLMVFSHIGIDEVTNVIEKYLKKYSNDKIAVKGYIIVKNSEMYLNEFEVKLNNELDFDLYNDGFEDVHNEISRSLKEDDNGVYLLYGCPGSGKTTYIRHLIKQCSNNDRKFVYVPSELVGELTGPNFLSFLIEHKGCVFIIEDCESLVTNVDGVRSGVISNLLNMTDGLLADALNIKFICTFNTDEGEIDEALLRPGRCRARYKFELLEKERANKVAKKLGLKEVDGDVSLAELFNPDNKFTEVKKTEKKMGFR